jgi:transcriptional regulator with XRE-family HTH domain
LALEFLAQYTDDARVVAGEQFGRKLRALRLEAGMTQEDLAHAAKLHPSEISRVERAHRDPRLTTIIRLAAGLDVPPASLLEPIP